MLQYALNDAKSVVYVFIIFLGLIQYLDIEINKNIDKDKDDEKLFPPFSKEFFSKLKNKLTENKGDLGTKSNLNPNMILNEISLRCNELIKFQLKEEYPKLNISDII